MDNAELKPTMSNEDVEKVAELLEDVRKENDSIPEVDDTVETGETRLVNTTIDPSTGDTIL